LSTERKAMKTDTTVTVHFELRKNKTVYVHVTVYCVKFLIIKPTRCTDFSNLFSV